jgi:predicted MFS family arabinose efflux permease
MRMPGSTGRSAEREAPLVRSVAMRQLMLLTFFAFASFFLTLSALPSWAVRGGAGVAVAGTVTTAMLGCTVAVQGLVPAAVRRAGTARVLLLGLVSLGAPSPLYLVSRDLRWLVLASVLRGAGFAVVTVLGATLAAQVAPASRRGEAIGLYGLAIAIPNLVAVPVGVALTLSGHFAWVAFGGLSPLLAIPIAAPLARRAGALAPRQPGGRVPRREVAGIVLPSVMLLVVTLTGGGLFTFLPITLPHGSLAAVALAVFGMSSAVVRWVAGLTADRVGTRILLPASGTAAVLGLAGIAGGLLAAGRVESAAVVLAAVVYGAGYGATQNLTLLEAFARTERHGTASAVWNACFDSGTALGAFTVGLVAATGVGVPGAYLAGAVLIAATLPLSVVLNRLPAR